ncbi:dynamin protein dnm1 [Phellopilus nigrolimitatus]|nr:dynamin protein dnm1 [Phellopilus nigrolimitatus]
MDSDLISLVNKLQDTFSNLGGELDMPQIAVVGSQSAGKSSVLETIVGRDFLPRGSGIVTRRPLVLQLIHTPKPDAHGNTEWGQFLHTDKRFTDFDEIRKEIEQETLRVAGQNKGISKLPISLRIYSPTVLDLTLVDLPGLTKVPVGDQPSDIEKQIRGLVQEYIGKENCVILSVSPANVDLANSESLKLARQVDPQGRRTIGVLTKLDLMDAGTNALDVLTGRLYPLKLGFIGIVNRSQLDINEKKAMKDALDSEMEFFKTHPAYRNIAHKCGTRYLARTLNQVLMGHIRDKLPDMKARLNTLMGQTQQELNSFGDAAVFGDANSQGALVLRLMTQFARDFIASIEGTSLDISTKELCGGARIYYIFNDVFGHALELIDSTSGLDAQDIRTAIRNSTGPRPSLFVPEVAFELLVKPQIKLLEAPALRCVELVYEELVRICHNCTSTELQRFPRLHSQIIEVVSELLRERLGPTSEYTQSLIDIQAAYINTNHPAFVSGSAGAARQANSPQQVKALPQPQRPSSTEPINGIFGFDDEEDENTEDGLSHGNSTRSVSSTVHDRSKIASSAPASGNASSSSTVSRQSRPHQHQHQNNKHDATRRPSSTAPTGGRASSPSARDTFLNYFFGQQQNGMPPGTSAAVGGMGFSAAMASGVAPAARDMQQTPAPTGLMAGKQDGNNAAYDMKSLGKHIEAVPTEGAPHLTMREEMETNLIRNLIASYFNIVRQTVQDLVPKAVMHFLVNNSSQQVQNRLVSTLYKPDLFQGLLNEDETIVAERARVKALLDAYKDAFRTLSEMNLKVV